MEQRYACGCKRSSIALTRPARQASSAQGLPPTLLKPASTPRRYAMGGDCTNIAVLLQRYLKFCQQLSHDADQRLKEWVACARARQRTCGGPGLPWHPQTAAHLRRSA